MIPPAHESAPLRVLIAEDQAAAADLLAQILRASLDCVVDVAEDGLQAVQLARAAPPDVIVFDIEMPGVDGIEAARRIKRSLGDMAPFAVAVTGKSGLAGDLEAIDRQFDAVLSKPVDVDRLIDVLSNRRQALVAQTLPQRFDLAEVFTVAARGVMPQVAAKGLGFSFDYRGPTIWLEEDLMAMRQGLHRLLCAMVDMLQSGFVILTCDAEPDEAHPGPQGQPCRLTITAAGAGLLAPPDELRAVLTRLAFTDAPRAGRDKPTVFTSRAVCPNTGAALSFLSSDSDGVLIRAEMQRRRVEPPFEADTPSAGGARAWLIDKNDMGSSWLLRRLQRMGWAVIRLDHCDDAVLLLSDEERRIRAPSLLVVVEGPQATPESVAPLRRWLPPSTQKVFAVAAGSPALGMEDPMPGFDVRIYPFSPGELENFTRVVAAQPPTGNAPLSALGAADRPRVLVVDDNEINRIVASEMLQEIGYEVDTAVNGLEAIEHCKRRPPQAVLMDLDMPVLDGLDATRRLRELQRQGAVLPFSIVAATAFGPDSRDDCLRAGMDGHLTKPLNLSQLRQELRRVTTLQ